MVEYNLSQLTQSDKDILLPIIIERLKTRLGYRRELNKILKETGEVVTDRLLALYALSLENDANTDEQLLMLAVFLAITGATERAVLRISNLLRDEAKHFDAEFINKVARSTDIDIAVLIKQDNDAQVLVERIIARNVSYITSVGEQTKTKMEQLVTEGLVQGTSPKELKKQIAKSLKQQSKRAELIADDQVEKLIADLTAYRAKQAGLRYYYWRSRRDNRVRPFHRELDGKKQDSKNPNHGDHGMYPRQPVRCRCHAQWVVEAAKDNK